jgi:hypothetical protein
VANPHDALFRRVFADPIQAGALLRLTLLARIAAAVDWNSLEPQPTARVDAALAAGQPDLVFVARLRAHPARIALVIEHKSYPDPGLVRQLLRETIGLWLASEAAGPSAPLPAVVPLVVHHGAKPWTLPRGTRDLLGIAEPELAAALSAATLALQPAFDDLAARTESELLALPLPPLGRLALLMLQLQHRFGPLPEAAAEALRARSESDLDRIGERLLDARSLEEALRAWPRPPAQNAVAPGGAHPPSAGSGQLAPQPGPREAPARVDRPLGEAERRTDLAQRQAREEVHLDDLHEFRILTPERLERIVDGDDVDAARLEAGERLVERIAPLLPAAPQRPAQPRMVDQHVAHRARRRGEEVAPVPERRQLAAEDPQVGLVDQGGRLQGVRGPLPADLPPRDPVQVRVDPRQQVGLRRGVAGLRPPEQGGDLRRVGSCGLGHRGPILRPRRQPANRAPAGTDRTAECAA